MTANGLDYNTQRSTLLLREYGRQVQDMVQHALTITDRDERKQCAEAIIECMRRVSPRNKRSETEYEQTLWKHLAVISDFQLDIDYPISIDNESERRSKPQPIPYPENNVLVRHYGNNILRVLQQIKTMPDSEERTELLRLIANRMRRCLQQWSTGSTTNEKIIADIVRLTDGVVQPVAEELFSQRAKYDKSRTRSRI